MEMTRKEILNSSEYWQERAETQCHIEGIDCTIQLVDKQQLIEKAVIFLNERVCTGMSIPEIHNMIVDFRKSMGEQL